jgi:hypothetical protein
MRNLRTFNLPIRKQSLFYFLWALSFIATAFSLGTFSPFVPTQGGDASWMTAANEAVARHQVFGRDFIFTFGPWASAYTGVYHPATYALLVIGCVLLAAGLTATLMLLAQRGHQLLTAIATPIIVMAMPDRDPIFLAVPLLLLFSTIDYGARTHEEPQPQRHSSSLILLCLSAAALGVQPLIKGSFTLVDATLLVLTMIALMCAGKTLEAVYITLIAIASLIGGWLLANQPLNALIDYFTGQLPIISGYSEAMALPGPVQPLWLWLAVALTIGVIFIASVKRYGTPNLYLLALGLIAFFWVACKAGFVRQDDHVDRAFEALVMASLGMASLVSRRTAWLLLLLSLAGWTTNTIPMFQSITHSGHPEYPTTAIPTWSPHPFEHAYQAANQKLRHDFPFEKVRGTVDAFPMELSPLFAFAEPWSGRPTPQSYSAYTAKLETIDASFLLGPKAADNIFLSISPIDLRSPTLEDGMSWPILLTDYRPIDRHGRVIRLIHTSITRPILRPLTTMMAGFNKPIAVPNTNDVVLVSIHIHQSTAGQITNAVFKLPPLLIRLTLQNGKTVTHRYVAAMGQLPFVLSPNIDSLNDFVRVKAGEGQQNKVASVILLNSAPTFWINQFEVQFFALHVAPDPPVMALIDDAPRSQP